MFGITLGILLIPLGIGLLIYMWRYHLRYIDVRDRIVVYDAVVTDFSSEEILPLGFFSLNRMRRCDITVFIPDTEEELQISSMLLSARRYKTGKKTKIYYFPDEIYDPKLFLRQKLLPFEIFARTPFSILLWSLFALSLAAIGVWLLMGNFKVG
jgi:hypothetical protein